MMGCAMSDDTAEHLRSATFSRRPHPRKCGLLAFRPSFQPNTPKEFAMTIASHPLDALMEITARPPAVFAKGEGSYLWDITGKRYLDFIQGGAVTCLGHSPPAVADALAAQAKLLLTPSPAYYNAVSLKLAKALVDHSCFDQVFFANSGAEANEGAIKLARKYGALHKNGAYEIITFGGGVPLAALLATEKASCFEHGDQGGTFNGNPLMCAAGLVVLEQISQDEFLKSAVDAGRFLESELQKLSARHGLGDVRGRGLLLALDLKLPIGASLVAQAFEAGVLLNSPQPDALRFMPALNVTREEISEMIYCLDVILTKAGAARRVA